MDPEKVLAAIAALKEENGDAALLLLEEMIASAAGGGEDVDAGGEEALAEEPGDKPAEEGGEEPKELAEDKEDDKDKELSALAKALQNITGESSAAESIVVLGKMKKQVDTMAAERAVLELSRRRDLIASLVKLDVEVPATAWSGDAKDRKPCKRLSAEPIEELSARVKILSKGRKPAPTAPESTDGDEQLSEVELLQLSKLPKDAQERYRASRMARKAQA